MDLTVVDARRAMHAADPAGEFVVVVVMDRPTFTACRKGVPSNSNLKPFVNTGV
jgi:hypothetical protein